MKRIERGAVHDNSGNIIGYKCTTCGEVFDSMLGDNCNRCWTEERRHQEILKAIKENKNA